MKKILFGIILCIYITGVEAQEYSEYSEFSDYSTEIVERNDLTDVKVERRYKFYKLDKVLGPYMKKGEENTLYPLIDNEDYSYGDYSVWSSIKSQEDGIDIEEKVGYHYLKVKPINYLKIISYDTYMNVSDLKLTYRGEKIDYDLICSDCKGIDKGDKWIINFKEDIEIKDLELEFNVDPKSLEPYFYQIVTGKDEDYTVDGYGNTGTYSLKWQGSRASAYTSKMVDYYTEENISSELTFKLIETCPIYRFRDILYRHYNLKREYYMDYLVHGFGDYIYKDENDYKDYFAKRTRSIIERPLPAVVSSLEEKALPLKDVVSFSEEKALPLKDNEELKTLDTPIRTYYGENTISRPNDKNDNVKQNNDVICYIIGSVLVIISVIILFLSKLYKKKK